MRLDVEQSCDVARSDGPPTVVRADRRRPAAVPRRRAHAGVGAARAGSVVGEADSGEEAVAVARRQLAPTSC